VALRESGFQPEIAAAIDNSPEANAVYDDNFGKGSAKLGDIAGLVPSDMAVSATAFEQSLTVGGRRIGLLMGGPPCQGHSDLNNHTRRCDPRNALYLHMARAAAIFRPDAVVIENVQGSPYDRSGSVGRTVELLRRFGYHIDADLVDLSRIGVPQRRRRFIILATLREAPPIAAMLKPYEVPARDLRWAIGDLENDSGLTMDRSPGRPSAANARRMDYLFERGLYDLPDSERPPCHRDRAHSYTSVYGRLHWDRPAPTITGGFYSMGMGRYVHPSRRRTLTPREAARLQFFPDYFSFDAAGGRTAMARIIGNAVPMKLAYALTRELLALGILRPF
jgi:DNA (cytosine-5)-methyltransferase 1